MALVTYECEDHIATITLNRPEARNALNNAVRTGLFDAVRRFNDDDAAKVLVLTGVGDKAFCAGGDLKEMAQNALKVPPKDFAPQFGRNIDVAKPTIAAVNGVAFAGGFLLAQQCDLVVAAEHATFAVSEVKVGRGSPWAAPLSWLVPPRVAMQILLTGDPITAETALAYGLINRIADDADVAAEAMALARKIADKSPYVLAIGKQAFYEQLEHGVVEAYAYTAEVMTRNMLARDAEEGIGAFVEKRPPVWQGQ